MIKWYIKKRGEYDFDSSRVWYEHRGETYEIDVKLKEWTTERGWKYRVVSAVAHGPRQTYFYDSEFLIDVPVFTTTQWRLPGNGADTEKIENPTRVEQINIVADIIKSQIRGSSPRNFETEQALREAFADDDDDDVVTVSV